MLVSGLLTDWSELCSTRPLPDGCARANNDAEFGSFDMKLQPFTTGPELALPARETGFKVGGWRPGGRGSWIQTCQCLLVVFVALASYHLTREFLFQSVCVSGMSMSPTLRDSSRYLLNCCVYHFRAPRRGEIVVLRDPGDGGLAVKRIIAAAGDCVLLRGGRVYVNGRKLDEPYLGSRVWTYPYTQAREQSIKCGDGQYVVFGDNRGDSADSRCYGPISRNSILGRVAR